MDGTTEVQPRILIVEDDAGYQRLLELALNRLGCVCHCCADGRSAMVFLESYPFDMAFIDLHIPELDGFMVAFQLREMGYSLPLIAVSALQLEGIERKAKAVGFNEFFAKPVEPETFENLLARYTRKSQHPA